MGGSKGRCPHPGSGNETESHAGKGEGRPVAIRPQCGDDVVDDGGAAPVSISASYAQL